jgi:hypothetical protein
MKLSFCLLIRRLLCWTVALIMAGFTATGSAQGTCYSTPNVAIDAVKPGSALLPASKSGGYRVTGIQSDLVLGRTWAIVANCDHAEWPVLAVQTSGSDPVAPSKMSQMSISSIRSAPVVHVGDVVRLWKQDDLLRIEVAGVSEESGGFGKTVRVRLLHRNMDDQTIPETLSGVVRGPSDVEIQP